MKTRLQIDALLREFYPGAHFYFKKPSSVKLQYPAVIYSVEGKPTSKADNKNYLIFTRYKVTIIENDPESTKADEFLEKFPTAKHTGSFVSDGLQHNVFTITNN